MTDWNAPINAVLFDRDGTLVHDVPYNGDPARVQLMPHAAAAVTMLRAAGVRLGVVSNQSGIGRGLITPRQVESVNARVDELVGGLEVWAYCPHTAGDRCACRKPAPGLVLQAAARLGVPPAETVVIGDIAADLGAAAAAGARAILVPTPVTRPDEIVEAPVVARDLLGAARLVLAARQRSERSAEVSAP
jgi:HAD superfamily hydrolase (TIGR01662 family)